MGSESLQSKLDRVRRPRVQIKYEVETDGAMRMVELPFVVGVMADLSGKPKEPLPAVKDRKFTPIDRDNFNTVMAKSAPRLVLNVPNRLTEEEGKLSVELNFKHMDDFEPARLASQVPALAELLKMRDRLNQLLGRMEGKDKAIKILEEVLANKTKVEELVKELGIQETGDQAAKPEGDK